MGQQRQKRHGVDSRYEHKPETNKMTYAFLILPETHPLAQDSGGKKRFATNPTNISTVDLEISLTRSLGSA